MSDKISLKITYVPIESLKKASYNPRKWSTKAFDDLKSSIKEHGFADPLIVNSSPKRKNILIGGHFRIEVAKSLGMKTVPVVYINIPDLKNEKSLNLRLNRNTGEFDLDLLRKFEIDFLLDIGFDDTDLNEVWADLLATEDDGFDVQKAIEEIKDPVTQPGDLYQLGNHKLLCGDSTNLATVQKLVGTEKIDLVISDPPYNISVSYDKGIGGKSAYGGKTNDNKSEDEYRAFIKATMENSLKVAKKDAHLFYWCDQNYIWLIQTLYEELGISNKRTCLWIKNNFNPTPKIAFNKGYEPCVYGTIGQPYLNNDVTNLSEIINRDIASGNRTIDDIVDLFDIWLCKRVAGQEYLHPTQKEITLLEKPLKRCTKINDNILDLFGGSGTTLLAAEQLKRKAFLTEIEPVFCDIIIRRFEEMTGLKAKKLNQ